MWTGECGGWKTSEESEHTTDTDTLNIMRDGILSSYQTSDTDVTTLQHRFVSYHRQ